MAKKKTTITPLSDFELDGIWMSYRYCIGRKSISSNMRAGDILQNCYERLKLNPNRMSFMAFDINRSIEDILRWGQLNVYFDSSLTQDDHIFPLDEVINAIVDENGYVDEKELEAIKKINIRSSKNGIEYQITTGDCDAKHYPLNDILDLMVWSDCAKILDMTKHFVCKVKFNDKEEYIEYVELYAHVNENGRNKFVKRKIPVEKYVKNNLVYSYINEEYIIEDKLPLGAN